MAIDLVCHMNVDESDATTTKMKYKGMYYYFCTNLCQVQFEANPEKYIRDFEYGKQDRNHKGKGNPAK